MATTGTVIDFATGRMLHRRSDAVRSVSEIAEALRRAARLSVPRTRAARHYRIRLDELSGVSDGTVARLDVLATKGVLNPASAARLAMRHAQEIRLRNRCDDEDRPGIARFTLTLRGDVSDRFAIRIETAEHDTWVGAAPACCLDRLLEACPEAGPAICLFASRGPDGSGLVRAASVSDWHVATQKRARSPSWKRMEHVVVVGGLPRSARLRSHLSFAVDRAVRRLEERPAKPRKPSGGGRGERQSAFTRSILSLVELARPGLLGTCNFGSRP